MNTTLIIQIAAGVLAVVLIVVLVLRHRAKKQK
jgi:hypothetical protein